MQWFILGLLAGASSVGLIFNRTAYRWEAQRSLMEQAMVRVFERRLGMTKGTGQAALETWRRRGFGGAQFVGVEVTSHNFPDEHEDG